MKPEYVEEIEGIANASKLPISSIVIHNIFYEILTFCTSIIARVPNTGFIIKSFKIKN